MEGENIRIFLDDILLYAQSLDELIALMDKVFKILIENNLTIDPAKIQICKEQIDFLGFSISKHGTQPASANLQKIDKFPVPTNVKQMQSFLGLCNYFRMMVKNYAELVEPLTQLTKKNQKFIWTPQCNSAFKQIQEILLNKPAIKPPDFSKVFILTTDASSIAISGILSQIHNGIEHPVEYYSKKMNDIQKTYPSTKSELYAIFSAFKNFCDILLGRVFTLQSDAKT